MTQTIRNLPLAKKSLKPEESASDADLAETEQAPENAIEEGRVFDYITGNPVKDTDKEHVRQRIARAIIHEYGIAAEDMEPDYKIKVGGRNKKIDIAVFRPGTPHSDENLFRAVAIEKEPKVRRQRRISHARPRRGAQGIRTA